MNDVDFMDAQQRKFEDAEIIYAKETNEVFRELVRQLILAGTVFLSISVFAFNIKGLFKELCLLDKYFLSLSWIIIGLSIVFGICQFVRDYYYFRKWHEVMGEIVGIIYSRQVSRKNFGDTVLERQESIPKESSVVFVWLQLIFLIIGLALFVFTMVKFAYR